MSWIEWSDKFFRGLDLTALDVDQAFFNVTNHLNDKFYLYSLSSDCIKCPFRKLKEIRRNNETVVKLDVARNFELRLFKQDHGEFVNPDVNKASDGLYWSSQTDLGEFGVYDLILTQSGANKFIIAKEPVDTNSSIVIVTFLLVCLYWIFKSVNKFGMPQNNAATEANEEISPSDNELEAPRAKKRLKSLDIFRGIAIVLMIFVNNGGGHYWWIEHAVWNGLHIADLVFPWFLFIMGVCIPMSIKSLLNKQIPKAEIMNKIIKRSITLFIIGLCLNTTYGASFGDIRIFGVLQRFGVAYLIVSLTHLLLMTNAVSAETRCQQLFYDIRVLWRQWIVVLGIILVNLATIFLANAPNCDRGYLGPGGIHEYQEHFNCTGGVVGLIDRTILGDNHLYQRAKIRSIYNAPFAFDPEGIFGCLLTCVQVFLGVQCGMTLLTYATPKDRLRRWKTWGIGLMIVTAILTKFSIEDGLIPINKNLWSLSYVTITASLAFFLLSIIYYIVDVKNWGDDIWTIFLYPGMNAIALYVGHTIFHKMWPFHWSFQIMNTHFILLLENIYTVIIWILISHYLYHRKLFYSI